MMKDVTGESVKVGIAKGLGGPELNNGLANLRGLLPETYKLEDTDLSSPISEEIQTLLIIGPKQALTQAQLQNVNKFVLGGASLGVFGGTKEIVLPDPQQQQQGVPPSPPKAKLVASNVNDLLRNWGAEVSPDLVIDFQCGQVPVNRFQALPYPPFVRASHNEEQQKHPVAFKLRQTLIPFSSSVRVLKAPADVTVTPLVSTSDQSFALRDNEIDLSVRQPNQWAKKIGESKGPYTLAVAIEGKVPNAFGAMSTDAASEKGEPGPNKAKKDVRIFVSGSEISLTDSLIPKGGNLDPQSAQMLAFILNTVDWLSSDADLIMIRAKNIEDPALDVPAAVSSAEDDEKQIADELNAELKNAQKDGLTEEEAKKKVDAAVKRIEGVREEAKQASKDWDNKTFGMAAANVVGVPALVAVFGLFWWRSRNSRKDSK